MFVFKQTRWFIEQHWQNIKTVASGKLRQKKISEQIVESWGPDEHHAMENYYVLSPDSAELSDEQWNEDDLFEDNLDTDFLDVEDVVNEARSWTSFAGIL